jgi:hypothetical protein
MSVALARHDTLMRAAMEAHGAHIFKTMGWTRSNAHGRNRRWRESIRASARVPHPRHWEALRELADS